MQKRKNLLLLGVSALMCLTACGGGGNGDVDRTLPDDLPTQDTEIIFWHCLGHAKTTQLEKIVTAFNNEYKGSYHVKLVHLGGDYDSLHTSVKTKLSSGDVPALTMGYPDSFAEYITKDLVDASLLRLDSFINDPKFGYKKAEKDDFVPGYYNEGINYQFDGVWSMPMYKSTEVMYYNRSYFDGLNQQNKVKFANNEEFKALASAVQDMTVEKYRPEMTDRKAASEEFGQKLTALRNWCAAHEGYVYTVPTKWDDMIALGKQMQRDRTAQNVVDEFYPIGYDSDANMFITQFAQRGIPYTVNDDASKKDPQKHFAFVNDQAKAFVGDVLQLVKDKVMVTKGSLGGTKYTNDYFGEGKLVMTIGSTGGSSYNISSNFQVELAPVPYAGDTPKYIQQGPSICFFNNDDDYIHKGAWLFYKMLAEPQANAALALENSYDPIRISSYETEQYKKWIGNAGQGLKYDIPAITATLKNYYYTSPTFVGSGTARTEIGSLIKYTYLNNRTIDDAFAYAFGQCKAAA